MRSTSIIVGMVGLATFSSAFPAAGSNLPVCGAGKTAVCADNQECHKIYCSPRPGSRVCKCVPQGQEPEDPFVAWGLPRTPHHTPEDYEEGPVPHHGPKPHGPPKSYGKPKPYDEPEPEKDCYLAGPMARGGSGCRGRHPKPHGYLPYDVPKPHHVPKPSSLPKPFGDPKYKNTTKPIPKPHHDPKPTWIPENPMIGGPRQPYPPRPRPHGYLPYDKPEPHAHPKPHPDDRPKEYYVDEMCAALCSSKEVTLTHIPAWCDCVPPKPHSAPVYPKPYDGPKPYEESPDARDLVIEIMCTKVCHSNSIEFPEGTDVEALQDWCRCPVMRGRPIYPLPHYPGEDIVAEKGKKKKNDHYFD